MREREIMKQIKKLTIRLGKEFSAYKVTVVYYNEEGEISVEIDIKGDIHYIRYSLKDIVKIGKGNIEKFFIEMAGIEQSLRETIKNA